MTSSFCASCLRSALFSASRSRWRRFRRFAELGYDTVLISQYGGCSETCEPWQGRVYIDDVFTIWNGEINGDSGKSRYCGKWFPLLSSAIRGGLFHPNCRQTMSLYIDGVTKIPPPIPAEQIRKQRELEARQRAMERKIRKLKRLEAGTQDPQAVKEYGRKLKQAQQEMKAFVDENHDVLRRDYEREKYYGSGVDKSGGSGIIEKETDFEPLSADTVVPVLREDSNEWINRLSPEEVRAIKKYTKNSGDPKDDKFYARLNSMLRGDIPEDDTLKYYSDVISGAISKFELKHDIICYRSVKHNPVEGMKVGDIYEPEQFISTAVSISGVLKGDYFITFLTPKGSKGAYIELLSKYPKQRELLFDKNLKYRILEICNNEITLEVIT